MNNFGFFDFFSDTDFIGPKFFNDKIDVTDPCYNKDVWCRTTVNAVEGTYDCYAREGNGETVASAIVNSDVVDDLNSLEFEYFTDIGVDAGMAGYFNNKPDYTQEEWTRFWKYINRNSNDGTYLIYEKIAIDIDGFFTDSGGGDGSYPVYIAKENDKIVAVAILYYDFKYIKGKEQHMMLNNEEPALEI